MMPRMVKRPKKGKTAPPPKKVAAPMSDHEFAKVLADAQQLIDEMNIEGAILLYEEALESRPHDTKVMDALGEALFNAGQLERAEAVLSQSAEAAPTDGYSKWMYLGQIYEGMAAYEAFTKGVALLEGEIARIAGIDTTTADVSATNEAARIRRELSDGYCSLTELFMTDLCDEDLAEAKAEEFALKAGTVDDTNPEAYRVLANVRLCQNRRDEAGPLLARAVELIELLYPEDETADGEAVPTSVRTGAALAATHAAMSALGDDHSVVFDKLMQIPPYDARLQLAKTCMEVEQWEPAVTIIERLLEEDDTSMEVFYLAGEANFYAGDTETAIERLTTADEVLTAAIYQAEVIMGRVARGKKPPKIPSVNVPPEVLEVGLDELLVQQSMIRKLMAVVNGEAAPHEVKAAAGALDEDLT